MLISHNQLACYEACSKQYEHKYVLNTEKDADYIENTDNFHYGSVVHKIAEFVMTNYFTTVEQFEEMFLFISSLFEFEHMEQFTSLEFKAKMYLHYKHLLQFKDTNNIVLIKNEIEVKNDQFYGRIDAILEVNKEICLVDYKTCASFDLMKPSQLHNDMQLNLYYNLLKNSYNITKICHIELLKSKYKLTAKDANNYQLLAQRIEANKTYEDFIRFVDVDISKINEVPLQRIFILSDGINKQEFACNFNNCINKYRQKCPYFKQCNKE
jgi:hypothetical protein